MMRQRRWLSWRAVVVLGALLLAMAAVPDASAQNGSITGRITDSGGAAVSGAQVVLAPINRGTITRSDGVYRIESVPAGSYTLQVRMLGYRPAMQQISVAAGQSLERHFTLEQDFLNLQEVVVTATRTPRQKLETSTAITTVSEIEIQREQPRSTADLLTTIPGFYVESSGGEVGGNLFARGLPADGSYRYVAMMENGMPVFDATELFFVNADIFVRVDENMERFEAVRGGNSALFGSNAPGGVINFIDKSGGEIPSGSASLQVGTDGLARISANSNGPAGQNWLYSIGGFYRYDQGVRDPGDFPASNGGQIKANVTRRLDRGALRLFGKYLDDRNIFYLPLPFRNPSDPEFVPGFPDAGTLTTSAFNGARVPLPNGGALNIPLDDGQRQRGGTLMADLALDLSERWSVHAAARAMSIDHTWNALLPFNLLSANELAANLLRDAPAGSRVEFGAGPNPQNNLVSTGGLWHIDKPMTNVSGLFEVRNTSGPLQLTLGTYVGRYTVGNTWYFNDVITRVENAPGFPDVRIVDAQGQVVRQVTQNGFTRYLSNYVNADGNVTLGSVFAGLELAASDALRLDLGVRYETDRFVQDVEGTRSHVLGNSSVGANAIYGTGQFRRVEETLSDWAASAGANYLLSDQASVYARASRGYKMPLLDNFLFASDPSDPGYPDVAETLYQAEVGTKVSTPWLGLSLVGYWLQVSDFPSQDVQVVGGETRLVTAFVGQARTLGLEAEAVMQPLTGLRVNATGTFQNPEYTDFLEGGEDFAGNRVRRIPRVLLGADVTYQLPAGLAVGGEWNYVGERFSNNANTVTLPDFAYLNGRLEWQVPDRPLTVALGLLNALNSKGLTEGNPRVDEQLAGPQTFFLARPILPRRWTLTARYAF